MTKDLKPQLQKKSEQQAEQTKAVIVEVTRGGAMTTTHKRLLPKQPKAHS